MAGYGHSSLEWEAGITVTPELSYNLKKASYEQVERMLNEALHEKHETELKAEQDVGQMVERLHLESLRMKRLATANGDLGEYQKEIVSLVSGEVTSLQMKLLIVLEWVWRRRIEEEAQQYLILRLIDATRDKTSGGLAPNLKFINDSQNSLSLPFPEGEKTPIGSVANHLQALFAARRNLQGVMQNTNTHFAEQLAASNPEQQEEAEQKQKLRHQQMALDQYCNLLTVNIPLMFLSVPLEGLEENSHDVVGDAQSWLQRLEDQLSVEQSARNITKKCNRLQSTVGELVEDSQMTMSNTLNALDLDLYRGKYKSVGVDCLPSNLCPMQSVGVQTIEKPRKTAPLLTANWQPPSVSNASLAPSATPDVDSVSISSRSALIPASALSSAKAHHSAGKTAQGNPRRPVMKLEEVPILGGARGGSALKKESAIPTLGHQGAASLDGESPRSLDLGLDEDIDNDALYEAMSTEELKEQHKNLRMLVRQMEKQHQAETLTLEYRADKLEEWYKALEYETLELYGEWTKVVGRPPSRADALARSLRPQGDKRYPSPFRHRSPPQPLQPVGRSAGVRLPDWHEAAAAPARTGFAPPPFSLENQGNTNESPVPKLAAETAAHHHHQTQAAAGGANESKNERMLMEMKRVHGTLLKHLNS